MEKHVPLITCVALVSLLGGQALAEVPRQRVYNQARRRIMTTGSLKVPLSGLSYRQQPFALALALKRHPVKSVRQTLLHFLDRMKRFSDGKPTGYEATWSSSHGSIDISVENKIKKDSWVLHLGKQAVTLDISGHPLRVAAGNDGRLIQLTGLEPVKNGRFKGYHSLTDVTYARRGSGYSVAGVSRELMIPLPRPSKEEIGRSYR